MTAFSDLDSAVAAFQARVRISREAVRRRQGGRADPPRGGSLRGGAQDERVAEAPEMLGQAPAMQDMFRAIGRLSHSAATVLITGESGTGKELVARALHRHSPRANGPFIALNTAAIPKDLLESELFGHERGAFTGAQTTRQGRFEQAENGTLFLDEIGDMPFDLQTRLLRVLSDGQFYRVGGHNPLRANVRVIAATHQNLGIARAAGAVPRGPLPPAQRDPAAPAAARTQRGHRAAHAPLPAEERARSRRRAEARVRRSAGLPHVAGVSRQRAPAREPRELADRDGARADGRDQDLPPDLVPAGAPVAATGDGADAHGSGGETALAQPATGVATVASAPVGAAPNGGAGRLSAVEHGLRTGSHGCCARTRPM